jgi:hypothetical protein
MAIDLNIAYDPGVVETDERELALTGSHYLISVCVSYHASVLSISKE